MCKQPRHANASNTLDALERSGEYLACQRRLKTSIGKSMLFFLAWGDRLWQADACPKELYVRGAEGTLISDTFSV